MENPMNDKHVREQLVNALSVQQAHMLFDDAVKDFPAEHYNTRPVNTPYSFWHLIEHLRMTQWDIVDYIQNSNYQYREFPKDYWPHPKSNTDASGWNKTIQQFHDDLQALIDIVNHPDTDLYAQIPHAQKGHTILREINIVATHNAYHVGELGILRAVMGLW
jgi:DinB superfamily